MQTTLIYLFDPLCGWCYGATPTLSNMADDHDIVVELLPTGLFSGEVVRPIDDDFAAFAWSNDQRIASLTGQRFTECYRELVLGNRQKFLDSGPATVALTAVSLTAPLREFEALKAIQLARFVDGQDVTELQTLSSVFESIGLEEAASMIQRPDVGILKANRARINRAQAILQEFSARGVPTLVADSGDKRWLLHSRDIYSDPHALISQLNAVQSTCSAC